MKFKCTFYLVIFIFFACNNTVEVEVLDFNKENAKIKIRGKLYNGALTVKDKNDCKGFYIEIKDGKKNGKELRCNEKGQKIVEGINKGDKLNGLVRYWYDNGKKKAYIEYKKDLKNGKWFFWDEYGNKEVEEIYKDGKLFNTSIIFFKNGNLKQKANFENEKLNGKVIHYYEDGEKMQKNKINNKIDGRFIYWDINGKIIKEELWENGYLLKKIK